MLAKKPVANAVKLIRGGIANISNINSQSGTSHSITYQFPQSAAIVDQYEIDENSDMFQLGRSSALSNDFVVMGPFTDQKHVSETHCTVSRFACRVVVDRRRPNTARIFAAGFDSSKNIFSGEKALK